MKYYLTFYITMYVIASLRALTRLAKQEYPRMEKNTAASDAIGLFVTLALIVWPIYLLFHLN